MNKKTENIEKENIFKGFVKAIILQWEVIENLSPCGFKNGVNLSLQWSRLYLRESVWSASVSPSVAITVWGVCSSPSNDAISRDWTEWIRSDNEQWTIESRLQSFQTLPQRWTIVKIRQTSMQHAKLPSSEEPFSQKKQQKNRMQMKNISPPLNPPMRTLQFLVSPL